jgi:C4-dicarboxylate transporter DctM subunit
VSADPAAPAAPAQELSHGDGGPILPPTRLEIALVVLLSTVMMLLPVVQIIARRFGKDVPGASVYTQHATLWLGFLGALAATAGGRHLGLATANFLKPGKFRTAALILGGAVATLTAAVFAYAAWKVVQANRGGEATLTGGVPEWWSELIVPITCAGISLRFLWRTPGGWRTRIGIVLVSIAALLLFGKMAGEQAHLLVWPTAFVVTVAFLLGAPVFIAMAGLAMLFFYGDATMLLDGVSPIAAVPTATLQVVQNPTLPAIPLLTLAGFVLASGGASQRLVRAFKGVFGWMPGGVAIMVISVCAMFTTFTGGSGVTILALGGILLPALVNDKYPEGFSLGLVTAAGSLGLLFPPSLPVILYSFVAGVDADKLYSAGLLPGLLLVIVCIAYAIFVAVRVKAPRQAFDAREMVRALWAAKFDLLLPLIVVGAWKLGFAVIVEAAALGALYTVVVELVIHREIHPTKRMPQVFMQSATLVGAVVILLGVALGLTNYLVDAQIPEALVDWVQAHFHSQWSFLLALNGLLLVLGSVFEIYAAIIVLAPLVVPLGQVFQVDPVHLGVVFLANLEVGFLFPPMGLNLFLSASRFGKPLPYLYRKSFVFLMILAAGVLVITYVPWMTSAFRGSN